MYSEFSKWLVNDSVALMATLMSIIVTTISIIVSFYLFYLKRKSEKKYKEIKSFVKQKRLVLKWWNGHNLDIISDLHSIRAERGCKNKFADIKDRLKRLRYELILLTEDTSPLEIIRALAYLNDRPEAFHLMIFQFAKDNNIPDEKSVEWDLVRAQLNDAINKQNVKE